MGLLSDYLCVTVLCSNGNILFNIEQVLLVLFCTRILLKDVNFYIICLMYLGMLSNPQ